MSSQAGAPTESRDTIGHLLSVGFIAAGPRSLQRGAAHIYMTTKVFLSHFGFDTFRDVRTWRRLRV